MNLTVRPMPSRQVPSMPTLAPHELLAPRQPPLPDPFERPQTSLWYSARVALWQAIDALDLPRDMAVAVPSFCCGSELEPFLAAGMRVAPFELGEDLAPEPASFARALEGACAALVTHYFGFPTDLDAAQALCRERGVMLIEDCAHALYARDGDRSVGLRGDASVFSFWKTVAMPDGGALHLKDRPLGASAHAASHVPPDALVQKATRSLLSRHARSHPFGLVRFGEELRSKLRRGRTQASPANGKAASGDPDWELVRFHPEFTETTISKRSLQLLRSVDHQQVREARRRNYAQLDDALRGVPGIRPVFPQLSEGACPLYYPAVVDDAPGLRKELAAASIGAKHIWPVFHPGIDWDAFPRERRWKHLALGFPVHQSLRTGDIDRIASAIVRWARP